MLSQISAHLRQKLKVFFLTDDLVFKNKVMPIVQEKFEPIGQVSSLTVTGLKTIAYVDGGQAEILSGGNICLSFIRVFGQVMRGSAKIGSEMHEFYVLTTAVYKRGDIWYESKIFPMQRGNNGDNACDNVTEEGADTVVINNVGEGNNCADEVSGCLVDEEDLVICSHDTSINGGGERAAISSVANMARRLAELKLASRMAMRVDYVVLDGTLDVKYPSEEKYRRALGEKVCALAKSCSLFTTCGNNPVVLLRALSPLPECWSYHVDEQIYFVRLHAKSRHIFRFEGCCEVLGYLAQNSCDALFLGYPYGLILVDKMARVSNVERDGLRMKLLLRDENREFVDYLNAMNAHDILDRLG